MLKNDRQAHMALARKPEEAFVYDQARDQARCEEARKTLQRLRRPSLIRRLMAKIRQPK